jgi:hypothetical protein
MLFSTYNLRYRRRESGAVQLIFFLILLFFILIFLFFQDSVPQSRTDRSLDTSAGFPNNESDSPRAKYDNLA